MIINLNTKIYITDNSPSTVHQLSINSPVHQQSINSPSNKDSVHEIIEKKLSSKFIGSKKDESQLRIFEEYNELICRQNNTMLIILHKTAKT